MSRSPPSLRLQLNLHVAAVIAVLTAILLVFQLIDTRRSVRDETEAANRVANHLLGFFIDTYGSDGVAALAPALDRLGRIRSTELALRDSSGTELHRSPPSPYKAGRDAPRWYARLVEPPSSVREVPLPDGRLTIRANPSRSILDGWDRSLNLLKIGLVALLLGIGLAFWMLRRLTRPLQTIARGLEQMQAGDYRTRLPELPTAETTAIARAFNAAAAAVEENLEARREATEAKVRLEQSRLLTEAIERRVEEERRLISQELHDEAGQGLTAIRSMATAMTQAGGPGPQHADAARLIAETAAGLYAGLHDLIPRLRPAGLDDSDLATSLEDLLGASRRAHPDVAFVLRVDSEALRLDEAVTLAAYRIVQEAITNSLRHAGAQRVEVALSRDAQGFQVDVVDDGRGLADGWDGREHFGIRGMRERARSVGGLLEVTSSDTGARVRARLPLERAP
ncbi:MAG: ATP-binding protein [Steroidobacteraceae bacterium]